MLLLCAWQVSKSANYCSVGRDNPIGCLLLCEVALGSMNELYHADYNASQLPKGKLSTKGVGLTEPDKSQYQQLDNGCVVPCGKGTNANTTGTPTLQYNEYIGTSTATMTIEPILIMPLLYSRLTLRHVTCMIGVCVCVVSVRCDADKDEVFG